MWTTLLYYNWIAVAAVFLLSCLYYRHARGLLAIALGIAMQVGALRLYWYEWDRLAGQPDRLYVWITPTVMCGLSIPILAAGIAINIMTGRSRRLAAKAD